MMAAEEAFAAVENEKEADDDKQKVSEIAQLDRQILSKRWSEEKTRLGELPKKR